jgi:hypothetical protein
VTVTSLSERMARVQLRFGFMEKPDVPKGLKVAVERRLIDECNLRPRDHYPHGAAERDGALVQGDICTHAPQCPEARGLLQYPECSGDGNRRGIRDLKGLLFTTA